MSSNTLVILEIIILFDLVDDLHHAARYADIHAAVDADARVERGCEPRALPLAPLELVKVHCTARARRGRGREWGVVAQMWAGV